MSTQFLHIPYQYPFELLLSNGDTEAKGDEALHEKDSYMRPLNISRILLSFLRRFVSDYLGELIR